MRQAFAQASSAQGDVVKLSPERIEQLVQSSADRADGLQWRRALADVAATELQVSVGEALHHPVVIRAQDLAGAPSYEDSLAALTGQRVERRTEAAADRPAPASEGREPGGERTRDSRELRVGVIHLGGIANLPTDEEGIDIRLSHAGLDIIREDTQTIIGRLPWSDIEKLEVPPAIRRRRRRGPARLVVRTMDGDASFEVPSLTNAELQERLEPVTARYGHG